MDIKNLSNHQNGNLNGPDPAGKSPKSDYPATGKSSGTAWSDKVSLEQYPFRNNEQLFAKLELEKLHQASFDNLALTRTKLSKYESAKQISREAADKTEMGKILNSPVVWEKIAQRMTEN